MYLLGVRRNKRFCDNVACGKEFKWIYPNEREYEQKDDEALLTILSIDHLNVSCPCSHCGKQNYFSISID